eukprot:TRINITY_DN31152_c0_g1_i1.p1 TRINITY_DN31152_c0_g1~~TRINITY_DN31152_c0_g1_i1.p1  ORF type:complete len:490 (+),score=124.20 TRINITY_DN31152_c0_g1_i1:47-1471(+)
MTTTRVVVVGSGIAGLAAARTLQDNSSNVEVTVLEAKDRMGGRTFTDYSATGFEEVLGAECDIGASWIHGSCSENPVTRMKDALNLDGFVTEDDKLQIYQEADGEPVEIEDDRSGEFEQMVEQAQAAAEESDADISVWDAMGELKDDALMQFHMTNALEFNVGASPKLLSGKYGQDDEQFEGDEVLLPGGYSQIVEALAAGKLRLGPGSENTAPDIEAVTGDGTAVNVVLNCRVQEVTKQGNEFVVQCSAGSFAADHVIVAVPLGVLKKDTITFDPPLPAAKTTAIQNIGFGDVVKIGLRFDRIFWDENVHYFGLVLAEPGLENAEKFCYFLNASAVGKPVLFTFAFGNSAFEVEGWSDDELIKAVQANLTKVFGDSVGEVTAMWRSKWASDEDIGGAYAYSGIGSTPEDWAALSEAALDDTLHFAGEHTSHMYRGTVHGAFYSGQQAAREVLAALTSPEREEEDETEDEGDQE